MKTLLSIICSKKLKNALILIILLFFYIGISAISYATTVSSNISDSVFRLHVLANSDSEEDQNLKYKVRDALIAYLEDIAKHTSSKEEVMQLVTEHLQDFETIAKQIITQNGYAYDVTVEVGNFDFPTKNYGDISLPAGYYDALRVKIGEAKGQNWWCVMFPPLCFVNVTSGIVPEESKETMKENLNEEEYALISNQDSSTVQFKFKLIEWLQNTNILTAKK